MTAFIYEIWQRIISHADSYEKFSYNNQKEFSYRVIGNAVYPEGSECGIYKSKFEAVLKELPEFEITTPPDDSSYHYIYAILFDKRIRHKDW